MPGLSIASASQLLNLAIELSGNAAAASEAEKHTCPAGRSHRPSRQVPVEFSKSEAAYGSRKCASSTFSQVATPSSRSLDGLNMQQPRLWKQRRPRLAQSYTCRRSALLDQAFEQAPGAKTVLCCTLPQGPHPVVSQSRTSSPFMVISAGGA